MNIGKARRMYRVNEANPDVDPLKFRYGTASAPTVNRKYGIVSVLRNTIRIKTKIRKNHGSRLRAIVLALIGL